MTRLPSGLEHAQGLFAQLLPELVGPLSELAERAVRLLGPFPRHSPQGDHEPDGYAGLGRTVNYERLVPSEWLLADELPDEFLRRAAAREHAFFELERRAPESAQGCVVELDAGPGVLGLPRVAMLAFLIALERRARKAGASFAFHVSARESAFEGLGRRELGAFLSARSAAALDATLPVTDARERWLLGSPRVARLATSHHKVITFSEHWADRTVELTLCTPRAAERRARIPMPPEPWCVRLLRDPFAQLEHTPIRDARAFGPFTFSGRGRRLLEWRPDEVRAHAIPDILGGPQGRARTFRAPLGHTLLGAVYTDRLIAVTARAGEVHVHGLPDKLGRAQGPARISLTAPLAQADELRAPDVPRPSVLLKGESRFTLVVPLAEGTLHVGQRAEPFARHEPDAVLESTVRSPGSQALWVTRHGESLRLAMQQIGYGDYVFARLEAREVTRVMFAGQGSQGDQRGRLVLVLLDPEGALVTTVLPGVPTSPTFTRLFVPDGARCVGATAENEGAPALIVLERDRLVLSRVGRAGWRPILEADAPILDVWSCPDAPMLAYATERSVTVYDMRRARVVWVIPRTGAP